MELVRVRETLPREKPPPAHPAPPSRFRQILETRACRYTLRIVLLLLIVLAVLLLFPGHAE